MRSEARNYYSDMALALPPVWFVKQPDGAVPVTYNLEHGVPDEDTFPLEDLIRLHADVLEREQGRALEYISVGWDEENERLQYIPTGMELYVGYTGLREELAKWLNGRSGRTDLTAENFVLTSGSVQAIALAITGLVSAGDGVIVESTSFPHALRVMEARQADVRTVDLDDDGLDPQGLRERLEEMVSEGVKPKLLYFGATFQCPTGVTTSLARRHEILALADEFDFLILEDDAYGELRYSGDSLPSLLALDKAGRVLQSSTFSKTVAPGLRLGWLTAPTDFIPAVTGVRQDLGVSQWTARVMELYVSQGLFDDHIAEVNDIYRAKRDAAVAAVRKYCEPLVSFRVPDGGCYLWLKMDDQVDWQKAQATAELAGVMFRPGERFVTRDAAKGANQYIRLAFSHVKIGEIERGIEIIGEAIKSAVRLP